MLRYIAPILVFLFLVGLFLVGLQKDPRILPSPLIDKPVPAFELPQLKNASLTLSDKDLLGNVVMFNVWASWCVSCVHEHPLLMELSKKNVVDIYGLNYTDERENAMKWLQRYGDPFTKSVSDLDGRVGIDFGVYAAPETFILDKQGIIRYKYVGPIYKELLESEILPMINKLKQEPVG